MLLRGLISVSAINTPTLLRHMPPSLCAVWRTPVCHARGPRLRGYVAGRLTRVRGNPRTGKLHGFESSNIEQRRCAEGDREAVSRRRPALHAAPWRWR